MGSRQARQPLHQSRDSDEQGQNSDLQSDEGQGAAIDVACSHLIVRHTAQIEECESEGWCQKRGLQVGSDQNPEPDDGLRTEQLAGCRQEQGNGDEGDFKEIDEEAQKKDDQHAEHQKAHPSPWEVEQKLRDQLIAADASEHKAEGG